MNQRGNYGLLFSTASFTEKQQVDGWYLIRQRLLVALKDGP